MAGIGAADLVSGSLMPDFEALFSRLYEYLNKTDNHVRYYGGMRFSKGHSSDFIWQPFSSYRFIVPQFELFRDGSQLSFACNILLRAGEDLRTLVEKLLIKLKKIQFVNPVINDFQKNESRLDTPAYPDWKNNIQKALSAFNEKRLDKIVLARKTCFKFKNEINPVELLWHLRLNNHRAYYFCFETENKSAFIGGTPEQLYFRSKLKIHTEALAGTRKRGRRKEEDDLLEQELLSSEKDIREHRYVTDSIKQAMDGLCSEISDISDLYVLKLSRLQHLCIAFTGLLKNGVKDSDILDALHPTPAVGGVPTERAVKEIENIEQFDRGWYAAPIGWVSENKAEFAVALRSGLIHEHSLYLYSGAGIVDGSDAEKEWDEIENKIAGFKNIIERKLVRVDQATFSEIAINDHK